MNLLKLIFMGREQIQSAFSAFDDLIAEAKMEPIEESDVRRLPPVLPKEIIATAQNESGEYLSVGLDRADSVEDLRRRERAVIAQTNATIHNVVSIMGRSLVEQQKLFKKAE